MDTYYLLKILASGAILWLGVYIYSRNNRSRVALLCFVFLLSISVFNAAVSSSINITQLKVYRDLWHLSEWSYLLPIAILFHFSVIISKKQNVRINRYLIVIFYLISGLLTYITNSTSLIIEYNTGIFVDGVGMATPRGPYFWIIALFIILVSLGSIANYALALKNSSEKQELIKYRLAITSSILYSFLGPILVYLYYLPTQELAILFGPLIISIPFIPILVAIIFYKLISDTDKIFNLKEFLYLSTALLLINLIGGTIFFVTIAPKLGEELYILTPVFLFMTILTHGFYDWLNTFIRDLLYNRGRGFNIITDKDVTDLVKDFHRPELLEMNPFIRFKAVRDNAKKGKLIDSAQELVIEAIEYFKQKDFPRRTKMNMKYQLLKMLTTDDCEEGQILWELGFEGYPMKIMSGENGTRKPLFRVESMSDYTATSRNAFIALKKEALHDLGWRLSYLEKTHNKSN